MRAARKGNLFMEQSACRRVGILAVLSTTENENARL
jgi:hypothetical protein